MGDPDLRAGQSDAHPRAFRLGRSVGGRGHSSPGPRTGGLAVHQDFARLVSFDDPARPGEYINVYATGLGQVSPAIETGAAAPASPLSAIVQPCDWKVLDGEHRDRSRPAEVLFAGLVPGLTGYYQVVWKIPRDVRGEMVGFGCEQAGDLGWYRVLGD